MYLPHLLPVYRSRQPVVIPLSKGGFFTNPVGFVPVYEVFEPLESLFLNVTAFPCPLTLEVTVSEPVNPPPLLS